MTAKELFVIANNCEPDDGEDWKVDSTDWKDQGLEIKQFYRKIVKWGNAIYSHVHKEQFNNKMKDLLKDET